jgi:ethanolamine utilization protein EutA
LNCLNDLNTSQKWTEVLVAMHDDDDHSSGFDLGSFEEGSTEEIEGLERFTLNSVGIDIGSSTTHVIFSRLVLRRQGVTLSARYVVTNREVLYRSPILLTPYLTATSIDTDQVKKFIERSYKEAGFDAADIDTGAVVITGEALKKENSRPILEYFSTESGKFICASAGPMHEALLAAYGSGAVALSRHHRNAVLDVDMGGGTTKISLIRNGEIVQMAAVEIGARLLAFDDDMAITRLEQPMRTIAKALGKSVELGAKLTANLRRQLTAKMADILFNVLSGADLDSLTQSLMLTDGLHSHRMSDIDHIVFSGGVSEYVYEHTSESYGDLGPELGREVRQRCDRFLPRGSVVEPAEGIRATVIGAGEYTLQASGSTSYISTTKVLPVRGIQVARAFVNKEQSLGDLRAVLTRALSKYDAQHLNERMALALSVEGQPDYPYIRRLAESITNLSDSDASAGTPLFLVLDVDMAKSLGVVLKEELKLDRAVIAIDNIDVGDLDYIDIGKPMGVSQVVPVTVKSLIFTLRSTSG